MSRCALASRGAASKLPTSRAIRMRRSTRHRAPRAASAASMRAIVADGSKARDLFTRIVLVHATALRATLRGFEAQNRRAGVLGCCPTCTLQEAPHDDEVHG